LRDFVAASDWLGLKLLPFFSMVDRRKALHTEVIASTRREFPELLATEVPYWSEIERMSERRAPLSAYAPHSPAGLIYATLWQEIQVRMAELTPIPAEMPVILDQPSNPPVAGSP
jgi:chromosome partitioning protein